MKTQHLEITDNHKTALAAYCQWRFSEPGSYKVILQILESDDPLEAVEEWLDGHSAKEVLEK